MSARDVRRQRVAVIGAGLAGLTCARALAEAGIAVMVFEKSRGVGGRMATRRLEGIGAGAGAEALAWQAEADHGVPSFSARRPAFAQAVREAVARGWLQPWQPRPAAASARLAADEPQWVATPAMKSWCAALAEGLDVVLRQQVDGLARLPGGWAVQAGGVCVGEGFDRVLLALPPAQAAALLLPHQATWAEQLAAWPMQATWTWMGVCADAAPALDWDVLRPLAGPLSRIERQCGRPWRRTPSGREVWTAHATPAWTEAHLEAEPAQVEPALRTALALAVGVERRWEGSWVHRWRYAQALAGSSPPAAGPCWWAAELGLAVCGDALGGGVAGGSGGGKGGEGVEGVEAAWTSGRALAALLIQPSRADALEPIPRLHHGP
jgi:hypothetical protein